MRLWLDDSRQMPEGYDIWARTASEAISIIDYGTVTHIAFDHHLGGDECGTGLEVALHIAEGAWRGSIPEMTWSVHTSDPRAAEEIDEAMWKAHRFWKK